jgi:hypothetical protein
MDGEGIQIMNAIYNGKLYRLGDELQFVSLIDPDTGKTFDAEWSDSSLIIDPTDDQINNMQPEG